MRPSLLLFAPIVAIACSSSEEAVPVDLEVVTSSAGLSTAVTDLGYEVDVSSARLALSDLLFTIEGEEVHEVGALTRLYDLLVPSAHAHPGHSAGGEVTGELRGDFVIDFSDGGAPIGTATLLTGDYESVDFTFRRAGELPADDELRGLTLHLTGTARRDDESWSFSAAIDVGDDIPLVGAPFQLEVREDTAATLAFELTITDPVEGDTAFDGIDFAALDADADGQIDIAPGSEVHNRLRRPLTSHDHYLVTPSP